MNQNASDPPDAAASTANGAADHADQGGAGAASPAADAAAAPRGVSTAPLDGDHTNTLTGPEDFPFSY